MCSVAIQWNCAAYQWARPSANQQHHVVEGGLLRESIPRILYAARLALTGLALLGKPHSAVLLPFSGGERALIKAIEWKLLVDAMAPAKVGSCQNLQHERVVSIATPSPILWTAAVQWRM